VVSGQYPNDTAELADEKVYEVNFEGNTHQVEAQTLENTENYLQVMVSVHDGSLPASFRPAV